MTESAQQSSVEQHKALNRRAIDEGWNRNNWEAMAEICAADVIVHGPAAQEVVGLEAFEQLFGEILEPFSDFHLEILHSFGDGDYLSTLYRQTGTHDGPLLGMPPTGKSHSVIHLIDYRFKNGKVVEVWSVPDMLGMLEQLGLGPPKAMMAVLKVLGKVRGALKR